MRGSVCGALFALLLLTVFFSFLNLPSEVSAVGEIKISSKAFKHNGLIPSKYTCDGADVSPPLTIEGATETARSLALIVDDPDAPAGTWVHWVVWNASPSTKEIHEGSLPQGAQVGMNDFRTRRYGGPCPPSGTHRYFFKIYALDTILSLGPSTTKAALEKAMAGHITAQGELIGLYKRK